MSAPEIFVVKERNRVIGCVIRTGGEFVARGEHAKQGEHPSTQAAKNSVRDALVNQTNSPVSHPGRCADAAKRPKVGNSEMTCNITVIHDLSPFSAFADTVAPRALIVGSILKFDKGDFVVGPDKILLEELWSEGRAPWKTWP